MTFEAIMQRLAKVKEAVVNPPASPGFGRKITDNPRFCDDFYTSDLHRPNQCRACCDLNAGVQVVWSGRDELIPARPQTDDDRIHFVPSYDLDEGEPVATATPKRKYTRTGNHTKGRVLQFPTPFTPSTEIQ